jgi:hypothetical protein
VAIHILLAFVYRIDDICAVFSVKEPIEANKQTIEGIINGWCKVSEGSVTFGWTLEDANKGFILVAWDSIEVRIVRLYACSYLTLLGSLV